MSNNMLLRGALAVALLLAILSGRRFAFGAKEASPPNGRLVVRLVNASGLPQANTSVSLFRRDMNSGLLTDTGREIRCDSSGCAVFDDLPTDEAYFIRATLGDRLVGYQSAKVDSDKPAQEIEIRVSEAQSATIHVRDEQGKPIAGATIWEVNGDSADSWFGIDSPDLPKVGIFAGPSNAAGELTLLPLPAGKIDVRLMHPKFAPTTIENLATSPGSTNSVTMPPGAIVELHFRLPKGISQIGNLTTHWSQDMTEWHRLLPTVRVGQTVELALKLGQCNDLWIDHPEFSVTPEFHKFGKQFELRSTGNVFAFDVRRKTTIHGRVLDRSTGKPLPGIMVTTYAVSEKTDGLFAKFVWPWTLTDQRKTGQQGEYKLRIPAGPGIVCMYSDGLMAQHDAEEINVAADGSTVVPDILVQPIPKVHGTVRDPEGRPVASAVLRFRDSETIHFEHHPVFADSNGRFEISQEHIYRDGACVRAQLVQTLLAFDPYRPLGAVVQVDFSEPKSLEHVELRLKPQGYSFPVIGFPNELAGFRENLSASELAKRSAMARGASQAPELDGAAWLNTLKPNMSLADFRGKYLLLHFWTTWCPHCAEDLPHLELANQLYRDKGLAVVCVHDNSVPINEIKRYVADHKIHFPVVIDRPDGRILAGYVPHGAFGIPSDVLVGPDGRIVGHPPECRRVIYRVELLRQQLMSPLGRSALNISDGNVSVN